MMLPKYCLGDFVTGLCVLSFCVVHSTLAHIPDVSDEIFLTPWWDLTFSAGETVSIDCGIASIKLAAGEIQWIGPHGKPLRPDARTALKSSSGGNPAAFDVLTLTLKKVTEDDSGQYTCSYGNLPGKSVNLSVTTPDKHCGFEGSDICGWKVESDGMTWHRHSGDDDAIIHRSKGPRFDHTYGASRHQGHFMDIDVSHYKNEDKNSTGRMISPHYPAHDASRCLQFWMVFDGRDQGSMRVLIKPVNESLEDATELFVLKKDDGNEWRRQTIDIPDQPHSYQLVFEASVCSNKCRNAVTSVDDVHMSDGPCNVTTPSWPDKRLRVRLMGGTDERRGRVEILHEGQWGTVCSRAFGSKEAKVICKRLNLLYLEHKRNATFGEAGAGVPIHLQRLQCTGKENDLSSCMPAGETWGDTNCTHAEDAGVICKEESKEDKTVVIPASTASINATPNTPAVSVSQKVSSHTPSSSSAAPSIQPSTLLSSPSSPSASSSSALASSPPTSNSSLISTTRTLSSTLSSSSSSSPVSVTARTSSNTSTLSPKSSEETSPATPASISKVSSAVTANSTPNTKTTPSSAKPATASSTQRVTSSSTVADKSTTVVPGAGLLEAANNNAGVAIGIIIALVVAALGIFAVLYRRKRKGKQNAYITFGNPSYSRENIPANDFNMDSPLTLSSSGYTVLA